MSPKVSVIIPTYNRREMVQEAIDSVLAQTYTDYEIIVVDDGSTDGTGEVLQARYGDRIRYMWQENQGESVARNRGIEMSQGEYIAPLDSDDLWVPERLARQVEVLEAHSHVVLTFGQIQHINERGRILSESKSPKLEVEDLTLQALCLDDRAVVSAPITSLIKREALIRIGGYDKSIRLGEDYDLLLRLRLHGTFEFVPKVLGFRRIHQSAQHLDHRAMTLDERLKSITTILIRIFDASPQNISGRLRQQALANVYRRNGIMYYATGSPAAGRERLEYAAKLFPSTRWADANFMMSKMLDAILFEASLHCEATEETIKKARAALSNWPTEIPLSRRQRRLFMGRIYAALGFQSYQRHDRRQTIYSFLQACRHDYTWLFNIGVLSICIEVGIGTQMTNRLRALSRLLVKNGLNGKRTPRKAI